MPATYRQPHFAPRPPPALAPGGEDAARVVILGGGLVGLTAALDLARRGIASVLLDEDDTVSLGSRAICFAKRTLEIYGRLGLGAKFLAKGVTWSRGRVFHGRGEAFAFDLLPEQGHEYPAFVNLQQYYAEEWLVAACAETGLVDLRWCHRVVGLANHADGVRLSVTTPAGEYRLQAQWLLACDGARSTARAALGPPFLGQVFRDRFLIADVVMQAPFPTERWFWFDPPFHPGQSVLLHKQPDDVWRIDFQLGWDADPEAEKDPDRVRARVAAMLGPAVPFALDWVSVYTFRCRRLERFRHGRTLFLGDAAHQVSPFGARGGNSGVQDADNLCWKLAAVLDGQAPEGLLDSYDQERVQAAEENILASARSTDFISPKGPAAIAYRDAVLGLAAGHAFARPLVNSGRLSRPTVLAGSALSSADQGEWPVAPGAGVGPGAPAVDAPVLWQGQPDWLLRHLGAVGGCCLLAFCGPGTAPAPAPPGLARVVVSAEERADALWDHAGLAALRWGAAPGAAVLLRPDQHVAARFRAPDAAGIAAALARAMGRPAAG